MLAFAPAIGAQDFMLQLPHLDPQSRLDTTMTLATLARLQTDEGRVALRSSGLSNEGLRALVEYAKQTQAELRQHAKQIQGRICAKQEEYLRDPLLLAAELDSEGAGFELIRHSRARRAHDELQSPADHSVFHTLTNRRVNVPPHPGSYGHLIRIHDLSAEKFLAVYCSE
jgi:hypothetical protein